MAIALGQWRNAALDTSVPALRGFQANPHSALPLFDRQPACLQSGALIAGLPESLSALPLFRGALVEKSSAALQRSKPRFESINDKLCVDCLVHTKIVIA